MSPGTKIRSLRQPLRIRLMRNALRVCRDKRGVAGVEFAMVLPFMLLLLVGSVELADAINQDRKVSRIANSITDLVAQAQTVTTSELDWVMQSGPTILSPYPANNLDIVVSSVSFDDDGDASVDWSYGDDPWPKGSEPPIALPATIVSPNTSIVVTDVNLNFTPLFEGLFTDFYDRASSLNLGETYYLRPRLTSTVQCTNCP